MVNTLRGRLQLWYGLVLLGSIGSLALFLSGQVRAARFREVDAQLEAAARYFDVTLRSFPPNALDGPAGPPAKKGPADPDEEGPPPKAGPFPKGRPWDDGPPPRKGFGPERGPPEGFDPENGPPPKKGFDPANYPPWKDTRRDEDYPPPPPQRSWEQALAQMRIPPELDPAGIDPDSRMTFGVWRHDHSLLKCSAAMPPEFAGADADYPEVPLVAQSGDRRTVTMVGPHRAFIRVSRSVEREAADLRRFDGRLASIAASVLVVGLLGGWVASARLFRPLARISATAATVSAANLDGRIDERRLDGELAELARALNATFARLQQAFEEQARFTADASHELRTPLAVLRSSAELALTRDRTPEQYRETLRSCLRAAQRMGGIVQNLLTLAQADGGSPGMSRDALDLGEIAAEAASLIQPLAQEKGLSLAADPAEAPVVGDAGMLARVVSNLLANAVQYTPPGGSIRVALASSDGAVTLFVSDTGQGIPEADRPHVLERFYRVDKARSRASGGTGLGLSICKAIVEAHGGTLGFESKVGVGSTFWVRLPRRA